MPTADPSSTNRSVVQSEAAHARAKKVMPGGVSSPVRAFNAVGGVPRFVKEAHGCVVCDVDGNEYVDYVGSYGPLVVGHANDVVVAAVTKALGRGATYGMPTELETKLADRIAGALPGVDMVRFVNSGTEAAMSAIRLARAATGRDLIVKCIGCYHGHVDALLVDAGSGALTHGHPSSPGVPESITRNTISVHYNSLDDVAAAFERYPGQIACVAVEPVAGNMGLVPPRAGYLPGLRELCDAHGAMLLFDEVMTGFRVAWGGAQVRYDVRPDLTCLGKIIGGGLPVGAYAGRRELMEQVSPAGKVYQAGTLSGNPVAMSAGLATLDLLAEGGCYEKLESLSARLASGLQTAGESAGVPITVQRVGSMITPFFVPRRGMIVHDYRDATACNTSRFARFFHALLDRGVHVPPSQFEAWFVSTAHDDDAIDRTLAAAREAFAFAADLN
jgi:glutamate-1-semialdehyde 2,1-aminomutase